MKGRGESTEAEEKSFYHESWKTHGFLNEILYPFLCVLETVLHCHSFGLYTVYELFIFTFKSNK